VLASYRQIMIETIETSYSPLLKRGVSPPQSVGWSSSSSSSSSSYGTTTTPSPARVGEFPTSEDAEEEEDLLAAGGRREGVVDQPAKDDGDDSDPPPRPHHLRRNSSDGWSRRPSHSSRKPPRQQKYSTAAHRDNNSDNNNNNNATFDVATTTTPGGGGVGGGGILVATDNLHVMSAQVTAPRATTTTHREGTEGRSPDPSGRHRHRHRRRAHSHDVVVVVAAGGRRSGCTDEFQARAGSEMGGGRRGVVVVVRVAVLPLLGAGPFQDLQWMQSAERRRRHDVERQRRILPLDVDRLGMGSAPRRQRVGDDDDGIRRKGGRQ